MAGQYWISHQYHLGYYFWWQWTAAVAAVDYRDSIQWRQWWWCLMAAAAFDGVRWRRRWTMMRGQKGGARTSNTTTSQHNERMRGRCNERTTRYEGVTTSWRDETMRGSMTRRRYNERAAHQEAMRQPVGVTRGPKGGAGRNERTKRGDATTSWRNELARGWHNERTNGERRCNNQLVWQDNRRAAQWEDNKRRCDNQLAWQDDTRAARREATQPRSLSGPNVIDWRGGSHGHARVERKPEWLGIGDELQVVSDVVQKSVRARRHHKDVRTKMAHPFVRVLQGPTWF